LERAEEVKGRKEVEFPTVGVSIEHFAQLKNA
jgi:hypothetical protein